jgi:hypothetical protein
VLTTVAGDTEAAADVDDALALAFALRHPQLDLRGITTDAGATPSAAPALPATCSDLPRRALTPPSEVTPPPRRAR